MEAVAKKLKMGDEGEPRNEEPELPNCQDEGQHPVVINDDVDLKPGDDFGESLGTGIFPEELWLQVLDKLVHSQDILNVLKAFPVLDKSFQKKKAHWLFDQVLPHLMTKHLVIEKNDEDDVFLISTDLLKLRRVSKRWKNAVEYSIQNYADRHPINNSESKKSEHQSAPVGLPTNHFNYNRINKCHLGATKFKSPKQIDDFLIEMTNFEGNPFPGKCVQFKLRRFPNDSSRHFVMKSAELLQKYGEHLHVLDWDIGEHRECLLQLCKAIVKGLASVPNVLSLKFCGTLEDRSGAADKYLRQTCGNLFSRLEKLQSFEWQVNMSFRCEWVEHVIYFYGGGEGGGNGLRKLALDHKYWNVEMAARLKNLTELHILLNELKDYDIGNIRNVLEFFPNGQVKKFGLSDYPEVYKDRQVYIDELIGMVGEFQIENVTLEKINLKEKMSDVDAVGITSLHLDDSLGLSYEFLRRLPNLRFLSVHVPYESTDLYLPVPVSRVVIDEHSLAFKMRRYFWNADKNYEWKGEDKSFEIWKVCGKLEQLSASVFDGFTVYGVQFVRELGNKPFRRGGGDGEFGEVPEEEEEMDRINAQPDQVEGEQEVEFELFYNYFS